MTAATPVAPTSPATPATPATSAALATREAAAAPAAPAGERIVFDNVSKFYGDVLGVNRVSLSIPPGITGLVGPNGSGKTTLMNLMVGLLQPSRGSVRVLGLAADRPQELFRRVGYATQYDAFPVGLTGYQFVESMLRVYGYDARQADELAWKALERVAMVEAAGRKIAAYSKGMRQRVKLAQAIAHQPAVLVLDEPLNGLDPMARAELIALMRELSASGLFVVVSSHILHEVDLISDQVVMLNGGYVVAEGDIVGVRDEMDVEHPAQVLVRCDRPRLLAARAFEQDGVVEARLLGDQRGVLLRTRDATSFYSRLNRVVIEQGLRIDSVAPADADVEAVYQYLIDTPSGQGDQK
jgi:ABC-2 type transport system ATP-binding protein